MKHATQKPNRFIAVTFFCIGWFAFPFLQPALGQEELPDPLVKKPFQYPDRKAPAIDLVRASWLQAGSRQTGNEIIRSNWVMLGEGGDLRGRITGGTRDSVPMNLFALNRGLVVGQTQADSQGFFRIEGLREGAYTLVGYNPNRFVTFGLNLLRFQEDYPDFPHSIVARSVNFRDKQPICQLIQENAPLVQFAITGVYPIAETEIEQAAHFGWAGLSQFSVAAIPATTLDSQLIQLGQDGLLRGRIHQIDHLTGRPLEISQTKVMLVEQGEVVVETACDRNGEFEFVGMPSGEFGLVAFGKNGFAALGIQLARSQTEPIGVSQRDTTELASTNAAPHKQMTVIDLCLIQPESTGWINHFLHENAYAEALAQPRPQKASTGPCCVHCQTTITPGEHCGCYSMANDMDDPRTAKLNK